MKRIIKKKNFIFPTPLTTINNIIMFPECANMITAHDIADSITAELCHLIGRDSIVIDATANMGGNAISFAKVFKFVICFEINKQYADALKSNLEQYGLTNTIVNNCDFTNITNFRICPQAIFIDPPWYIDNKPNTNMALSNIPLTTLVDKLQTLTSAYLLIKLPECVDTAIIAHIAPINILRYRKMQVLIVQGKLNSPAQVQPPHYTDVPMTPAQPVKHEVYKSPMRRPSIVNQQFIPVISKNACIKQFNPYHANRRFTKIIRQRYFAKIGRFN